MVATKTTVKKAAAKKRTPSKPSWTVESSAEYLINVKGTYATDNDLEDLFQALTSLRENSTGGSLKGFVIDEIDSYGYKAGYTTYYVKKV